MATREKKITLNRKQATASPVPPKEGAVPPEALTKPIITKTEASVADEAPKLPTIRNPRSNVSKNASAMAKKIKKKVTKKVVIKKTMNMKAKNKTKLNKKIVKKLHSPMKMNDTKKVLLKNGIKNKLNKKSVKANITEDPPVLEPIYPINENVKQPKKKQKKDDDKKVVLLDDGMGLNEAIDSIINELNTQPLKFSKKKSLKKAKSDNSTEGTKESIEEVMVDLSALIQADDIKSEPDSDISEKPETKPRRPRVNKIDLLKDLNKKENLENKVAAENKVIDMLDLNVVKKRNNVVSNRRHSIDEFPMGSAKGNPAIFSNVPRSISPRTKRASKVRQSLEKRASPYTTRSDSPARILRNGKHRKLKDLNLLEGLDTDHRKRKRLCSDYSGSEISVSKSGYESDSSFSDLASIHGTENTESVEVKKESSTPTNEIISVELNGNQSKEIVDEQQKISEQNIDTNSNVCQADLILPKIEKEFVDETVNPSAKVPEKSIILDIMKQTFNDIITIEPEKPVVEELAPELPALSTASFYGNNTKKPAEEAEITEEIKVPEETEVTKETKVPEEIEVTEETEIPEEIQEAKIPEETKVIEEETIKKPEEKQEEVKIPETPETEETIEISEPPQLETSIEPINISSEFESSTQDEEKLEPPLLEKMEIDHPIPKETPMETTEESAEKMIVEPEEKKIIEPEEKKIIKPEEKKIIKPEEKKIVEPEEKIVKPEEEKKIVKPEEEEKILEPEEKKIIEPEEKMIIEPEEDDTVKQEQKEDKMEEARYAYLLEPLKSEMQIVEPPESIEIKETVLRALGLQSWKAAAEAKLRVKEVPKPEEYTGTLKTVIKLNRNDKKRSKKMLQKSKKAAAKEAKEARDAKEEKEKLEMESRIDERPSTSGRDKDSTSSKSHSNQSSETAGALRKSHYANRSNMEQVCFTADSGGEHAEGDPATGEDGKVLVIPEKASSFSIHPGRLCKDECSYCFGKFGLFDTPCHIAQMKSVERQDKILATEKHLTRDSCLCDACYRHVDRKSNTPSYTNNKSFKRNSLVAPVPKENHCHVLGCGNESTNILRRKWIIKMRKNICKVINIDLDNPGLHSIPLCDDHYTALEHLMTCAMCKRKLARNHIHYLGQEFSELNDKLNAANVPVKLEDKPVVCKLCKTFASLVLTDEEDRPENTDEFYEKYLKRLLHFHDVVHMSEEEAAEPIPLPVVKDCSKESTKKRKKSSKSPSPTLVEQQAAPTEPQTDTEQLSDQNNVPSSESGAASPSDYMVDYQKLIPNIAMECGSDAETSKKEIPKKQIILKKVPRPETVKEAVEISKNAKLKAKSDIAVQRLGCNPSISVRQLFPGEEDLPLQGNVDFHNIKERTPEGWEKCSATIQYDPDTKQLWQELQKPYGNQSSFLRHLILLEKYFRNGDLILSPNASHHSINYSESVQNRLRAYDNTPTASGPIQPLSMMPFNKAQKSSSGIITSRDPAPLPPQQPPTQLSVVNAANIPKNTPITITQLNNSGLLVNTMKQTKSPGIPPGLMPLQPGTSKPVAPLVKLPQPQKIKFPITKNWRPNLIPIDPSKKMEKKTGLVQVISGGKPYHITVEDYKKMCAIKRTFDLKQKKLQEAQKPKPVQLQPIANPQSNSLLKTIAPRKGLVISKTSTMVSPKNDNVMAMAADKEETILEKLDRQIEKLEIKQNDQKQSIMILPKIPKSLTVIPQTVPRKPSRPSSPTLQILAKPKASLGKS